MLLTVQLLRNFFGVDADESEVHRSVVVLSLFSERVLRAKAQDRRFFLTLSDKQSAGVAQQYELSDG